MSLSALVYKSASEMEYAFPDFSFRREPHTGEPETMGVPSATDIPWSDVIAHRVNLGNVSHIGLLRERIQQSLGHGSTLERLVLYSGSHAGDVIEDIHFGALQNELDLVQSSPETDVRLFAEAFRSLIDSARHERNPIVFV